MMGRKRTKNKDLPSRVYLSHGKYYFVDKMQVWHPLGKTKADMYANLALMERNNLCLNSMADVFDRLITEVIPSRAKRTREDYLACIVNLRQAFGHMRPESIKAKHIYAYMDARGQTAKQRANHEKGVLSLALRHAIRWGLIERNPCKEVPNFPSPPRDRCVEDWEFDAIRNLMPPRIQAAMDLAAMTGLRQGDILDLTNANLKEDGLHCQHSKTKKRIIYEWTPTLRAAIELAKSNQPKNRICSHLISTRDGCRYSRDGFKAIWQRKMRQAKKDGIIKERFTFHDLRSYAADKSEHAQRLLGHQSEATTRRIYKRKADKVRPNE